MDAILVKARELKQALVEFVLEAEGELAAALEAYSAQHARSQHQDINQRNLLIDTFLTEGRIGNSTPIDLFVARSIDLSEPERQLLLTWHRSFIGLFEVLQVLPDGFELMNWLTVKRYMVKPNNEATLKEMARFKEGDIILSRISPVTDAYWMFSGPCTPMGKLGKPKLAVAIGNFKQNYKSSLYSDAPELLELSWQSVEQYHRDFLEFFGSDEVTMPGYQFSKKLAEFQEVMTEKRLAAEGIDTSKSLAEVAADVGVEQSEIAENIELLAEAAGVNARTATKILESKSALKMATPRIELPDELKKAEQLTVLTHPRWGQMLIPNYVQFKALLEAGDWQGIKGFTALVRQYLEDPKINVFVWHRLAKQYPVPLEKVLQVVLERPTFNLEQDLDPLLKEFDKAFIPELPEIASVPIHLHNLFQEALKEVSKTRAKGKDKKKLAKGFQR